jgi:hypothetical protein
MNRPRGTKPRTFSFGQSTNVSGQLPAPTGEEISVTIGFHQ